MLYYKGEFLMKQKCLFFISDINAGWFDVCFKVNENIINISASDLYGNDSPKELLIMLTEIVLLKCNKGYVLFDEEPGTYVVSLEKEILTIAYSKYDCFDYEQQEIYIDLRGNMTFDEIFNIINIDEILLQVEIDIKIFIQSVYKAFYKYAKSHLLYDKYEENWGKFPKKQWENFQRCIEQKNWHKKEL